MNQIDFERRFGGVRKLYGAAGLAALQQAHVCVIGIGGVGSWAAEALARSAVGRITLIDLDHVAESNLNRQIHALDSTLGKAKEGSVSPVSSTCGPTFSCGAESARIRVSHKEKESRHFVFVIFGIF